MKATLKHLYKVQKKIFSTNQQHSHMKHCISSNSLHQRRLFPYWSDQSWWNIKKVCFFLVVICNVNSNMNNKCSPLELEQRKCVLRCCYYIWRKRKLYIIETKGKERKLITQNIVKYIVIYAYIYHSIVKIQITMLLEFVSSPKDPFPK